MINEKFNAWIANRRDSEGRSLGHIAGTMLGVSRPTLDSLLKYGFRHATGETIAKAALATNMPVGALLVEVFAELKMIREAVSKYNSRDGNR